MALLPIKNETFVSPLRASEVAHKLKSSTCPPALSKNEIDPLAVFIGSVKQESFKISLKVNAPENFLPIIYGSIDELSMGSIVSIKFRLFFSSLMFLTFWSGICILTSLFFFLIEENGTYGVIAIAAGALNYFVTLFYFHKKVKESHKALMSVLKMVS